MTFFLACSFAVVYWKAWTTSPSNSSYKTQRISLAYSSGKRSGKNDLVREFWDIPRPSSESNGKDDVGWTEDAFNFRSVWENSGQVDDPCS